MNFNAKNAATCLSSSCFHRTKPRRFFAHLAAPKILANCCRHFRAAPPAGKATKRRTLALLTAVFREGRSSQPCAVPGDAHALSQGAFESIDPWIPKIYEHENPSLVIMVRTRFMTLLWFVAIVGVWVLLQAVILPKFGIST